MNNHHGGRYHVTFFASLLISVCMGLMTGAESLVTIECSGSNSSEPRCNKDTVTWNTDLKSIFPRWQTTINAWDTVCPCYSTVFGGHDIEPRTFGVMGCNVVARGTSCQCTSSIINASGATIFFAIQHFRSSGWFDSQPNQFTLELFT